MQMKQPAWEAMPVLDVRALSQAQLEKLSAAYDELSTQGLDAVSHLDYDPNRRRIDDALSAALGLPSLAPIRELLAREPGLTARGIGHHPKQLGLDLDDDEDEEQTALL